MRSLVGSILDRVVRNDTPVPMSTRVGGGLGGLLGTAARRDAASQLKAMGAVGTLFGIVHRTSTATSLVDWHLYKKTTDGRRRFGPAEDQRTEVVVHPSLVVLNKPNPFTTRNTLIEATQQHIDLTGEGWILIEYTQSGPRLPLRLWGPIRPDRMRPVEHPTEFISGYAYTGPMGEQIPLDLDEVIFMKMPNPEDPYRGLGPVQAVLMELDSTRYSAEWNRNFFRNSAEPGGIIETGDVTLSDTEFDELRARWNEQHRGVANAHRVAILERGKWVPNAMSQRDMQFVQLRGVSRDAVLEAFTMPKSMMGITENVNRANAETGEQTFARWMSVPRLERFKAAFNDALLPKFGSLAAGNEFDYDNPVPESIEDENSIRTSKANAFSTLVTAGATAESAAEFCEMPEMEMAPKPEPPAFPPPPPGGQEPPGPSPEEPPSSGDGAAARAHTGQRPIHVTVMGGGGGHGGTTSTTVVVRDDDQEDSPASSVDLTPVAAALAQQLRTLLDDWQDVQAGQIDSLVEQVRQMVNDGNVEGLPDMTISTDQAKTALLAAMTDLATSAADQVVDEADAQGVTIQPAEAPHDTLDRTAGAIAGILARALIGSAAGEALRLAGRNMTADEVADSVRTFLASLTDARPRQYLGAGLHSSQHAARVATLAAAEHNPQVTHSVAYYASEVNDVNTCGPCNREDGRALGNTITDAEQDYPTGGYIDCEGGNRCRGHIVAVWTMEGSDEG